MSGGEGGGAWEVANIVPSLGGGAWEVANVPCLGERGEGPGKWLILYHVWGRGGRGLGSG